MQRLLVLAALYALTGLFRPRPYGGDDATDATVRLDIGSGPAASLTDATVQLKTHFDTVKAEPAATTNDLGAAPADMPISGTTTPGGGTGRVPLEDQRANEPEWAPGSGEPCPPELESTTAGTSPEIWVDLINGEGMDAPGRNNNCVDCSRAVEATWRGEGAMAAAMGDPFAPGTGAVRVWEWAGGNLTHPSYSELEGTLHNLGDNSSAIITSEWTTGGSHTYNAVNEGGVIKFVDGQDSTVSEWPPSSWPESAVEKNWVFVYDPDGNPA